MANVLWPGRDAIGQCLHVGSDNAPCSTVVGIAENMLQRDVMDEQRYQYYLPLAQHQPHRATSRLLKLRGLYSVISYNVAQRMHELAVRVALGARSGDILRTVVGQGIRFVIAGITIGSLAVRRQLASAAALQAVGARSIDLRCCGSGHVARGVRCDGVSGSTCRVS